MADLYFRQLLAGVDFGRKAPMAAQMMNYVYLIGDRDTRELLVVDPAWAVDDLVALAQADDMRVTGALVTHYHPDHVGGDLFGMSIDGISRLLDGPIGPAGPYRLEVTSPGLERRLRRPRHFEKAIGREVAVKLPGESLKGVLVAAGEHDFTLEVDGRRRVIPYDTPSSVKTVFTVPTKPKPGKR